MSALSLAYTWVTYEKNVETDEEAALRKLFQKVTPGVAIALKVHTPEAEQMTNTHPSSPSMPIPP